MVGLEMVLRYKPIQFRTVDVFNVHSQGILREVVVGCWDGGVADGCFQGDTSSQARLRLRAGLCLRNLFSEVLH